MTVNILADENIPAVEDYLGHYGPIRRVRGRGLSRSQLRDVDVLLVRSVTPVDSTLLAGTPVTFVGTATSGIDHIDRAYLEAQGIGFAYAAGANANSVVEYVLSAIAAVENKLEQLFAGGTVGIVGYGHVGSALAARLAALGVRYRVYDPWLDPQSVSHRADLETVLGCDVVSLHPELTMLEPWPSHHLVDAAALARMSPGTLLINASRGPVVDNEALLGCLGESRGPLTVLDVWDPEPGISVPLLQQVTLGTPHVAGYSHDGKLRATAMLGEALASHLQQLPPPRESPVNDPPPVEVPAALSDAGMLRFLLFSRYDIRVDDARLREVILQQNSVDGAGFDQLRKTYPQRRELAGSRVRTPDVAHFDSLIKGLGCIPSPASEAP